MNAIPLFGYSPPFLNTLFVRTSGAVLILGLDASDISHHLVTIETCLSVRPSLSGDRATSGHLSDCTQRKMIQKGKFCDASSLLSVVRGPHLCVWFLNRKVIWEEFALSFFSWGLLRLRSIKSNAFCAFKGIRDLSDFRADLRGGAIHVVRPPRHWPWGWFVSGFQR